VLVVVVLCIAATPACAAVVINELLPKTTDPADEWVELYNTGSSTVSLNQWSIKNNRGNQKTFVLNASNIIQPNGYIVLTEPQTGIQFAVDGDTAELRDNNNTLIDSESYQGTLGFNTPMGRSPDGANNWLVCNSPAVPNQPNNCPTPTPSPTPTVTPVPTPTNTPAPIDQPAQTQPTEAAPSDAPAVLGSAAPIIHTPASTPTPTVPPDMINIVVPKEILVPKNIAIEAAIVTGAWIMLAIIANANKKRSQKKRKTSPPPPTSAPTSP